MNMTRPSARPALGWLLSLTVIGLVGSLWAPTAHADNSRVSSTPEDGTTIESSPTEIDIVFQEALGASNTINMTCGDPAAVVQLGSPELLIDGKTLRAALVSAAPKGQCNVSWSVTDVNLQSNGSGSFSFTIANDPPAPTTSTLPFDEDTTTTEAKNTQSGSGQSASSGTAEADGAGNTSKGPLALFRLASNLGLAILFGALVVIAVAWPEGVEYIITVRFLRSTWMLTVATTFLFTGALASNLTGKGLGSTLLPTGWGDLMDSTPGKAAVLRFVFVLAASYVVTRPERAIDPATQVFALVPTGIAVATMAFSRENFELIDFGVGVVHVIAMSVWFGGLVLLTRVVLAGPGEEDLVHAVRGFSRISTPALWATVATGAVQLFRLDRGALTTSHGVVVIMKTLFVSLMVFVGVAARQFISSRLTRVDVMSASMATRLRRALGIEAVIGVLVMALTAGLLTLAPSGLAPELPGLDLGALHRFQNQTLGIEVTVSFSEKVGANDVRIEVVTAPATGISGLAVDFLPPADATTVSGRSINYIPLTGVGAAVLRKSEGFTLDAPGSWTIRVRIGTTEVASDIIVVNGGTTIITVPDTSGGASSSVASSSSSP